MVVGQCHGIFYRWVARDTDGRGKNTVLPVGSSSATNHRDAFYGDSDTVAQFLPRMVRPSAVWGLISMINY